MTVPPWAPHVQRSADGWQPMLLITDAVPTEEQARDLALYVVRQLDARMPDVAAQLDAFTATPEAAAAVPVPAFSSPA